MLQVSRLRCMVTGSSPRLMCATATAVANVAALAYVVAGLDRTACGVVLPARANNEAARDRRQPQPLPAGRGRTATRRVRRVVGTKEKGSLLCTA
eukprot:291794-Chlamydomonas_euryale.AAC.3